MPLNLNNNEVTGVDLNNTEVSEVRLNGDTVFTAGPTPAPVNRMYVADYANDVVRQYDLTNKFDLTGATQTAALGFNDVRDAVITDSGNRVIVSSYNEDQHRMYTLSTPYDIGSAGNITSTLNESNAHGISIDPSGVHVLSSQYSQEDFNYYTLGTPFDLNTASLQDVASAGDNATDIDYVKQGEYVFGTAEPILNRWELTTPYDFTTRTNRQTYSIPNNHWGTHVTDDGSKYFRANYGGDEVDEYNLSTPYDISSKGTAVDTLSVPNAIGLSLV